MFKQMLHSKEGENFSNEQMYFFFKHRFSLKPLKATDEHENSDSKRSFIEQWQEDYSWNIYLTPQ